MKTSIMLAMLLLPLSLLSPGSASERVTDPQELELARRLTLAPDELPGYSGFVAWPSRRGGALELGGGFRPRAATGAAVSSAGFRVSVYDAPEAAAQSVRQALLRYQAVMEIASGTRSGHPIVGVDQVFEAKLWGKPRNPRGYKLSFQVGSVAISVLGTTAVAPPSPGLPADPPLSPAGIHLVENIARGLVAKLQGRRFTITDLSPAEYEGMHRKYGRQMADFEARWALPEDALLSLDFRPRTPSINVQPNWSERTLAPWKAAPPSLFRHGHTAVTVEEGQMKLRESFWYAAGNGGRNIFLEIRQTDSPSTAAGLLARWKGEIPRWYEATQGTWSGSTAPVPSAVEGLTTGGLALPADEVFWAKPKDPQYAPFTTHYDLYFRIGNLAFHLGLEGLGEMRDDPWSRERLVQLMPKPESELTHKETREKEDLLYKARQGSKWFNYDESAVRSDVILGPGGITDRQRYLLENIAVALLARHYGVPYTITDSAAPLGPFAHRPPSSGSPSPGEEQSASATQPPVDSPATQPTPASTTDIPSPASSVFAASETSLPTSSAFLLVCGSLVLWRRRNGARAERRY